MSKTRLRSMPRRKNDKSLFVRIFSGFLLFFCTACFSAVFFGSIDYFHSTSAIDTDISVNVNPVLNIRIAKNNPDYWVLNGTSDEIRPYRILIKQI